jgi:pimeloyl-ACP methyl ester carboxylesterase
MTTTSRDDVLTIVLPDGRTLGYREYGDPAGSPCVYLSGTPASSAAAQLMDETAKEMGVRWIAVDKPGYGASTFQPERSLRSITGDVVALADLLGLQRFAVAGESGGGPWTLALAHDLHDRLTTAILIGGIGPTSNRSLLTGMTRVNRLLLGLARRAPWALRLSMNQMARAVADPVKAQRLLHNRAKAAPAIDRPTFSEPAVLAGMREALAGGGHGAAQEFCLFANEWDFQLEDIATHVQLFHGELDTFVPIAIARDIARRVPNCSTDFRSDLGHLISVHRKEDILQAVLNA